MDNVYKKSGAPNELDLELESEYKTLVPIGGMQIVMAPGSGTFNPVATEKMRLLRKAAEDVKTVIIDPENEYGKLAEMFGVKVTVKPDNDTIINPFKIEE